MKTNSLLLPDATVYGVIANDQISLDRLGDAVQNPPYKGLPKAPVLYIKPRNTWLANDAVVHLPQNATQVEVGAVLGLKMGRDAAQLNPENALDVVSSCILAADLSLPHDSYYRPAICEKAFDGALPFTELHGCAANGINSIEIKTTINGVLKDTRKLDNLIRTPAQLLADVTEFMTLYAGDVLLLGVVYQSPLAALGDSIKIEIPNLATLQFTIAKEALA